MTYEILEDNLSKTDSILREIYYYNLYMSELLLNYRKPVIDIKDINQDILKKVRYCAESPSKLVWAITFGGKGSNSFKEGEVAGRICKNQYKVGIDYSEYRVSRIVYAIHHGAESIKGMVIDHINRDSLDNTIENLRAVSTSVNNRNVSRRKTKQADMPTGVYFSKQKNSFIVSVVNPEERYLNGRLKSIRKSFTIAKYKTTQEALKAASDYREALLHLINTKYNLGYTNTHGDTHDKD